MKMLFSITVAILLVTGSPLHAKDRRSTPEEIRVTMRDYTNCIAAFAETLDDNVSDVRSIGGSAARQCRAQLEIAVDVLARGYNQRVHSELMDRRIAQEEAIGADVVLSVRAKRRAEQAP